MTRQARLALLLVLMALPLVLQGASLPHTHFGAPDGFFNQDHDLTLLAISGTIASLDAIAPALVLLLVVTAATVAPRRRATATSVRAATSRAPPAR